MKKKLPNVFANKIEKKINNNKEVYYSKDNEVDNHSLPTKNENRLEFQKSINQKIKEIFAAQDYIYKADVEVTYDNKTVTKRVIGYNSRDLITYDDEVIPIAKITDIRRI